jgi:hypothetical protein
MGHGAGAPPKFIKHLQMWLKASFGKSFKSLGNVLPHALQDDSYSCGIITANTLAHALFRRPLWSSAEAVEERLGWFIRIADRQIESTAQATSEQGHQERRTSIANLLNPIGLAFPLRKPTDYHSDGDTTSICSFQATPLPTQEIADSSSMHISEDAIGIPPVELPISVCISKIPTTSNASLASIQMPTSSPNEDDSMTEYDGDWSDSDSPSRSRKYIKAGDGTSKSAVHSRKRRDQLRKGTFKVDDIRLEEWRRAIKELDEAADFDPHDICRVRHSACSKFIKVKDPYDLTRFKAHIKSCALKKRPTLGNIPSLLRMGFMTVTPKKRKRTGSVDSGSSESEAEIPTVPCPGLTVVENPRIGQYLRRTGVQGGGGRSLPKIAKEMFKRLFSNLSGKKQRQQVLDKQMNEWKWRNDHMHSRVHLSGCSKEVPSRFDNPPKPCSPCLGLLRDRGFRNTIWKKPPPDENYIHVNHRFRNPVVGEIYARTLGVKELVEEEVWITSCLAFIQAN